MMPSVHGARLRSRPSGSAQRLTTFDFHEQHDSVWAHYRGGMIAQGEFMGKRITDDTIIGSFVQRGVDGDIRAGQQSLAVDVVEGRRSLAPNGSPGMQIGELPDGDVWSLREYGLAGRLMFICTGNFYRSRFAEHRFEQLGAEIGLDWTAKSRGMRGWDTGARGRMSPHSVEYLGELGVAVPFELRSPMLATPTDIEAATRIIALDEIDHRPLVEQYLPKFADRIEYWHIPDVDRVDPSDALPAIEAQVQALIAELALKANNVS